MAPGASSDAKILAPRGLDPARGAVSGGELGSFLLGHVLERHSPWLGAVLDLREGPSVIGPVSLRVMDDLCARAEVVRRRLAILVGPASLLKERLTTLALGAPRFATATDARRTALDWMTSDDQSGARTIRLANVDVRRVDVRVPSENAKATRAMSTLLRMDPGCSTTMVPRAPRMSRCETPYPMS